MERYISKAATLASEASKFSRRITQEIVDRSREVGGSPATSYDTSDGRVGEIRMNLDSKFDKEKIDGLKRLIAMMSKGRNVKEFFPDVVKLVASTSFDVRKLVYIYLLRYAEQEPDLALLSINTFQKDLTDRNPLIRAMALRVMSSIRVPVIVPLIMLALQKATTDLSPYVRKAAANALPKAYSLDPEQKPQLIDLIATLLRDNSTLVLGTVISAWQRICPDRFDLIHGQYRKLCRLLLDTDEWGQVVELEVLGRYARKFFLKPEGGDGTIIAPVSKKIRTQTLEGFYEEEKENEQVTAKPVANPAVEGSKKDDGHPMDPDHLLLLQSCQVLLASRNSSVVLTTTRLLFTLAPPSYHPPAATSLLRLLRTSREERYLTLLNICTLAPTYPHLFQPHLTWFFVYGGEPAFIQRVKIEILCLLVNELNGDIIVRELGEYARMVQGPDGGGVAVDSVRGLGRVCAVLPHLADTCLSILMRIVSYNKNNDIISESVLVIRRLLQHRPASQNTQAITQLARALPTLTSSPPARAAILWLIGQNIQSVPRLGPDTLRVCAKNFKSEPAAVKLQILNLAAKISCCGTSLSPSTESPNSTDQTLSLLIAYIFDLSRYDPDWDIRDRSRFLRALILGPAWAAARLNPPTNLVTSILLTPKPVTKPGSAYTAHGEFTFGTLSHAIARKARNYVPLPPWNDDSTSTSERDEARQARETDSAHEGDYSRAVVGAGAVKIGFIRSGSAGGHSTGTSGAVGGKVKKKRVVTLDEFYGSESSSSSEEEQEEEETEDSESEEEDSSEEGESEEEEEEEDSSEEDVAADGVPAVSSPTMGGEVDEEEAEEGESQPFVKH
ncbi:adaptin N terminal region-domain-containing protein [Phlyctochytrium arcticum]|nr:adaptin N terminal region-domain-containing protein [Phlyctochytrium arcticum]